MTTRSRVRTAQDPLTDPKILASLSQDESHLVRCHVAMNPSTPLSAILSLIKDESGVRCHIALNPSTSTDILATLSKDEDYFVRWNVARHSSTPYGVWIKGHGRLIP